MSIQGMSVRVRPAAPLPDPVGEWSSHEAFNLVTASSNLSGQASSSAWWLHARPSAASGPSTPLHRLLPDSSVGRASLQQGECRRFETVSGNQCRVVARDDPGRDNAGRAQPRLGRCAVFSGAGSRAPPGALTLPIARCVPSASYALNHNVELAQLGQSARPVIWVSPVRLRHSSQAM